MHTFGDSTSSNNNLLTWSIDYRREDAYINAWPIRVTVILLSLLPPSCLFDLCPYEKLLPNRSMSWLVLVLVEVL